MPRRIIGSNNPDGNIYVLRSGSWSAFDYPPPGGIGFGIWGGRGGAIWTHNGLGAGSEKFLHFDGDETWTQYDDPVGSASGPATIHGSDDGQYVYAGWRAGYVGKWDGSSWSQVASGWSARHIWCDPTGQHVYATDGAGLGFAAAYYSSDYGVTWADIYATIQSDIGSYPGVAGCVWGISANEVYITTRLGWPYIGYLLKYNGTSWSIAATNPSYGMDASGLWGNGSDIVAMSHNVSFDLRLAKKNGSSFDITLFLSALYGDISGWGKQIWGAGSTVVCSLRHETTGEEIIHLSTDSGSTWTLMSTSMAGYLGDISSWYEPSGDVDFDRPTGGHYNLFLKIDGLEPILWQYSSKGEPTEFSRSIKTCLRASNEASADLDLATMRAGLSAMTFELEDARDTDDTSYFGKLFAPGKFASTPMAHLKRGPIPQQYVDADATTIPISGDGANLSAGEAHIGQEAIIIGAAAADNLTDCQRGMYPCVGDKFGRTYYRPSRDESGYLMPVSANPYSWIGRRVALYATQWDDEEGEWVPDVRSELLWVGRISDRITQSGTDRAWKISCTSVLEDIANKRIATGLSTSSLAYGINLKGVRGRRFRLLSYRHSTGLLVSDDTIEVTAKHFMPNELIAEINKKLVSTNFVYNWRYSPKLEFTGDGKRAQWYLEARSPDHFVWFEYYDSRGFPCHATQALGFNRGNERALLEKFSEDDRVNLKGNYDLLHYYQPLHRRYNGYSVKVRQANRFWTDQGDDIDDDGSSAFAAYSIPKAFLSATDKKERSFYDTYSSRGDESFTLTSSTTALFPQMEAQVAEDGFAGNGALAKAPTEVKQVYIPRFKTSNAYKRYPFEMLLFPLLSTGTQGYNHSRYDRCPLGLAVGMQAVLVDIPSFQNADLAIKNFETAIRSTYVIEKPTSWLDLAMRECRLFGYAVVWRKGKLTLRNVLAPSLDRAAVEIGESSGIDASEYPDMDLSTDTVVNQYNLKVGYDISTRTYAYEFIITDAISAATLEMTKAVDLDHPGVVVPTGTTAADILEPFFADRWLAKPNPVVRVSLGHSMINKVHIGDTVAFTSNRVIDPAGSGTYETTNYATVIGVQWSFGEHVYSGAATLILHPMAPYQGSSEILLADQRRYMLKASSWGGSALIDQSAAGGGWDSVAKTLTLVANHFGVEFDIEDGSRFESGDKVIIVERAPADPDSPQEWGPFEVDGEYEDDGDNLLTLEAGATMAGFDSDKEYTVEAADYGDVPDAQLPRASWYADPSTWLLGASAIARRFG